MRVEMVDQLLEALSNQYGEPKNGFSHDYIHGWASALEHCNVQEEQLAEGLSRFLANYTKPFYPTVGEFLQLSRLKELAPRAAKPKQLENKSSEDWVAMEQEYKEVDRRLDPVAATKFLMATNRAPYGYKVVDTELGIGVVYEPQERQAAGPPALPKSKGPVRFADLAKAAAYG